MRLMSTRIAGRSRRKLSIGTRLCPPAMILASPRACAKAATALSIDKATTYSNAAGFMRSWCRWLPTPAQASPHARATLSRLPLGRQVALQRHRPPGALDQAVQDAAKQREFFA